MDATLKFLSNIDLQGNEIKGAKFQRLASPPESPFEGQIYYDTAKKSLQQYEDGNWKAIGAGSAAVDGSALTKKEFTISTGSTSASETIDEGKSVLAVLAMDATTHEVVMVDITVENNNVTASIAASYEHDITITLTVM